MTLTLEQYRELTPDQKKALRQARREEAIAAVKEGDFPTGIHVKVGEFTLTCRPTGVSEKGSIAYGHPAMVLQVGSRKVRVNQISLSVLNEGMVTTDADFDKDESII